MKDSELIFRLKQLIGLAIVEINYIEHKFYHSEIRGDWTNVNPNDFVLHSPEWQIKLSNGTTLYISSKEMNNKILGSEFVLANESKQKEINVLKIQNNFEWTEILNKPILKFRLWSRVEKSAKFLGVALNFKSAENFKIIDFVFGGKTLSFTTMNGDLGEFTFYPNGYFGDNVGVFLNKIVCTSHTTYGLTTRMKIAYES